MRCMSLATYIPYWFPSLVGYTPISHRRFPLSGTVSHRCPTLCLASFLAGRCSRRRCRFTGISCCGRELGTHSRVHFQGGAATHSSSSYVDASLRLDGNGNQSATQPHFSTQTPSNAPKPPFRPPSLSTQRSSLHLAPTHSPDGCALLPRNCPVWALALCLVAWEA